MAERLGHAMMPQTTHDEQSLESFLVAMRAHLFRTFDPDDRRLCNEVVAPRVASQTGRTPTTSAEVRTALEAEPFHQAWLTLQRLYQELLWRAIGESVDRQFDDLASQRDAAPQSGGSLSLDPALPVPRYLAAFDHHRMAGSYHTETAADDFRAGALYDRYASTYHVWRNGGWMNDGRGHTLASHIVSTYPELKVRRILDLGCAVGHSTTALKDDFPDAEVYAIDVGAPMLRYAHARAQHLGRAVHFSQQNAESTSFAAGHFDLVVSAVTLHETSLAATRNIFRECHRLLRPGGVMAHIEVPARYDQLGLWEQVRADFEAHYNNEPFMAGVARTDFAALAVEAGFKRDQVMSGYRRYTPQKTLLTEPVAKLADPEGRLALGSWFVVSAVR